MKIQLRSFLISTAVALATAFALATLAAAQVPATEPTSPVATSTPPVSAQAPAPTKVAPENKWRIECSEGANSEGAVVFRVTPKDGTALDVHVAIKNGTSENAVARRIRDEFKKALPKSDYSVETDDGEDVLVKARLGKPTFSLELVSKDVAGVRIDIERE
jgi:invasion protein IalB